MRSGRTGAAVATLLLAFSLAVSGCGASARSVSAAQAKLNHALLQPADVPSAYKRLPASAAKSIKARNYCNYLSPVRYQREAREYFESTAAQDGLRIVVHVFRTTADAHRSFVDAGTNLARCHRERTKIGTAIHQVQPGPAVGAESRWVTTTFDPKTLPDDVRDPGLRPEEDLSDFVRVAAVTIQVDVVAEIPSPALLDTMLTKQVRRIEAAYPADS
ncbi:MAG: hypothetical protein JWP74_936 [Marmoricola sp.]|nr:hypothetical protein [Marmoricola sp.]